MQDITVNVGRYRIEAGLAGNKYVIELADEGTGEVVGLTSYSISATNKDKVERLVGRLSRETPNKLGEIFDYIREYQDDAVARDYKWFHKEQYWEA